MKNNIIYQSDWLGSNPFFYNEKTGRSGHNINDVIDFTDLEFHPEGLNNYLDFGYSVFEQTPINNVKFLRYASQLVENGKGLETIHLEDPIGKWYGRNSRVDEVIGKLSSAISHWEDSTNGEIVIPTSGGYDSRLLNVLIRDRSRIRAFTYGISPDQSESNEVVKAKKLCDLLGINWEQIQLGSFHRYFKEWDELYGISTHAHGMYHIEFYTQLLNRLSKPGAFLSGIVGDAWAGSIKKIQIDHPDQIRLLGYSHGLHADSRRSKFNSKFLLREKFFEENEEKLNEPIFQTVSIIRLKIILLSYLIRVPEKFGFQAWSPFLEEDISMSMLILPQFLRENRKWQSDYFQKQGISIESMGLKFTDQNSLDLDGLNMIRPTPLDPRLMREVIDEDYVIWINNRVCPGRIRRSLNSYRHVPKIGGLIRRMGLRDDTLKAYNAYLTLKPIENLIRKRYD